MPSLQGNQNWNEALAITDRSHSLSKHRSERCSGIARLHRMTRGWRCGQQIADLARDLERTKAERERWERRVALLKADRIDPDMLDERARFLLNYADPRDAVVMIKQR